MELETHVISSPLKGPSVAVSADAEIILMSAPWDDDYTGARWVLVYNNSVGNWYPQAKLIGMRSSSSSKSREVHKFH